MEIEHLDIQVGELELDVHASKLLVNVLGDVHDDNVLVLPREGVVVHGSCLGADPSFLLTLLFLIATYS